MSKLAEIRDIPKVQQTLCVALGIVYHLWCGKSSSS